jgi:hypothetical protein
VHLNLIEVRDATDLLQKRLHSPYVLRIALQSHPEYYALCSHEPPSQIDSDVHAQVRQCLTRFSRLCLASRERPSLIPSIKLEPAVRPDIPEYETGRAETSYERIRRLHAANECVSRLAKILDADSEYDPLPRGEPKLRGNCPVDKCVFCTL